MLFLVSMFIHTDTNEQRKPVWTNDAVNSKHQELVTSVGMTSFNLSVVKKQTNKRNEKNNEANQIESYLAKDGGKCLNNLKRL